VRDTTVQVLGNTNLPTPIRVDLEHLVDGYQDAHWIELEGTVRRVSGQWGHVTLVLMTRAGRFKAVIPGLAESSLPTQLIDSLVSISGACSTELNARRQLRGITLNAPSLDMIRVLEPAPADPFATATIPIKAVATFDPDRLAGRRVKVHGVVTLPIAGQGFYLQDDTGGIRVQTGLTNEVQIGEEMDVLGFPSLGEFSPGLEEASYRRVGARAPCVASTVTAAQILQQGTNDGQLVTLVARLLQSVPSSVNPQLTLQDGSIIFNASLETPFKVQATPALESGSLLRLTGVCLIQGNQKNEPMTFHLRLRLPEDIQVLESPSWWTVRHALMLAGGMTVAIFVALAWIGSLRRQVRSQTEVIRQKLAAEIALETRYRELFENANDLLFTVNQDGQCLAVNHAVEEFFGLSRQQVLDKNLADLVSPDDQVLIHEQTALLMAGRGSDRFEVKARRQNDQDAVLDFRLRVIHEGDRRTGIQVTARDITERKKFAESLAREKNLLATLIDHLPDHVFVKDRGGRYVLTNNAHTQFHGATSRELIIGKTTDEMLPPDLAKRSLDQDRLVLTDGGNVFDEEVLSKDNHGNPRWLSITKVPLKDQAGGVIGVVGIGRDVTERKKIQAELLRTSRLAGMAEVATGILHNVGNVLNSVNVSTTLFNEHLQKSKISNLLRATSMLQDHTHDLATFLTEDTKGKLLPSYFIQVAQHLAEDQEVLHAEVAALTKNVTHLKEIVAMQQSYAKVSGVMEALPATGLMEDALEMLGESIQRQHIEVVREYQDVPAVCVDKHKALQILLNLLSNAAYAINENTANPVKRLVLGVCRTDSNRVSLVVQDSGVGIAPEVMSQIFRHGFTTKKDGHGFGLHLGALAAKELGGTLTAFSAGLGQGARFTLELPVAQDRPLA
jgi:PAS domain S-box-containing protein